MPARQVLEIVQSSLNYTTQESARKRRLSFCPLDLLVLLVWSMVVSVFARSRIEQLYKHEARCDRYLYIAACVPPPVAVWGPWRRGCHMYCLSHASWQPRLDEGTWWIAHTREAWLFNPGWREYRRDCIWRCTSTMPDLPLAGWPEERDGGCLISARRASVSGQTMQRGLHG